MRPCLQKDILQAYLDGELAKDAYGEVVAHLAECTSCAASVREAEQTLKAIASAFESAMPEVIPTARLRARIEFALAENAAPRFTLAALLNWKLAAVAAGILILISAMAIFWPSASSLKPQPEERADLPAPGNAPGSQTPPKPTEPPVGPEPVAVRQPDKPRKRIHRRAFRASPAEAEVVTQFFPLREGEDLAALENMRMVRVELPGTALREVGLQVTIEAANAPVIADVLLGQDGLARAIRFVR
jgi:hypothetical protein